MKLVDSAIRYPVTVIVGVFFLVLFGILSLMRIPVQLTPDVTRPNITVTTIWRGASPQEIEREIVEQQEEYLRSVEGLVKLTSESADSMGTVTLEFSVGTDVEAALLKVSNKLDQVPTYPADADKPIIVSAGENAPPIAWIILERVREDAPQIYTLLDFAEDEIQTRLERVPGIAKINVYGGREREMQVVFDSEAVAARKLTIKEMRDALSAANRNISAGDFDEGKRRYIARTEGEFLIPEDADRVTVKWEQGSPVIIKDVAKSRFGYKKATNEVRQKGKSTLAINAVRQAGTNVLEVMNGLKKGIDELNQGILASKGLRLQQVYDETEYIDSAIELVRQNLWVGGTLAILVLLFFLRSFSTTLIIATAIPISIVGTFILMVALGRNINVISLAGMSFAAGMVVDNSIVVLENIYRLHQQGESKAKAAYHGTSEVWGAVLASTLTTVAVFLPVIFVEEEAGQLFRDISIAVSCSVFLSLLVSITVIPSLAARIIRRANSGDPASVGGRFRRGFHNLFGLAHLGTILTQSLGRFIYWVCGSKVLRLAVVMIMTGLSLGIAWVLSPQTEYLPGGNRNLILGIMIPPPGYNLDEYREVAETVESTLRPYWEDGSGSGKPSPSDPPHIQNFFFVAWQKQLFMGASTSDPNRARELIPLMQDALAHVPGMIPIVLQTSLFERGIGQGRSIDVDISGPDLRRLIDFGGRVFGATKGLIPDAQILPVPSLDLGNPEVRVIPARRRSARVGLTAEEIGLNVDALLDGAKVGEVRPEGKRIDLTLMGQETTIRHTQDFRDLLLNSPTGERITLGTVADVYLVDSPTQINHIESQRAITIRVSPPEDMPLQTAMDTIQNKVVKPLTDSGELKPPYRVSISGTADDLTRTRKALQWNFLLALVITFLLMSALFENFLYPLIIMFSVPLAAAGGFLGLYLTSHFIAYSALDVLTMLGFVILVGVVVNNAILIVYQALNFMREAGLEPRNAIRRSVEVRIRPIFMTALTSVFGMLPLVLFPGAGSELYRGLGSVVVGGLIVSTVFTLILVPSLFSLAMDLWMKTRQAIEGPDQGEKPLEVEGKTS
ncbi:MAG: efflux RND transporter permease subunit [Deltaproteobacteria bacterium]|nr:efflux RND transporter permease subunit [Deltaproteobacteria bacterium]